MLRPGENTRVSFGGRGFGPLQSQFLSSPLYLSLSLFSLYCSMEDVLVQDPHPTAQNNKVGAAF